MPKVHFVKAARKDNPAVKAGEPYYWWQFRFGGKRFSKTPPRSSQLTQSEKLSRAYELAERLEDIPREVDATTEALQEAVDNAISVIEEVADEVRTLADEYRDSAENIRSSFSDSPTADECDEKADNLDGWADEIGNAQTELQGIDFSDSELDLDEAISTFQSALGCAESCPL